MPPLTCEKILHTAKMQNIVCKCAKSFSFWGTSSLLPPLIWPVDSQKKIIKILDAMQKSDFKATMHQISFRLRLCPRPTGELTALPGSPSCILGAYTFYERERVGRRRGKGKGNERRKKERSRGGLAKRREKGKTVWFSLTKTKMVKNEKITNSLTKTKTKTKKWWKLKRNYNEK